MTPAILRLASGEEAPWEGTSAAAFALLRRIPRNDHAVKVRRRIEGIACVAVPFNRVFSDEQRLAVQQAYCDEHIRPHRRISELAAEGKLKADGEKVKPFKIDHRVAGEIGRREARKRSGEADTALLKQAPMDAVEVLRRRLLSIADHATQELERTKRGTRPDVDYALKTTRLTRELAALSRSTSAPVPEDATTARRDKPSPLASAAIASLRATSDSADTASNDGPKATDSEETPERTEPESVDDGDGADIEQWQGTQPERDSSSLAGQLHRQLYGQ